MICSNCNKEFNDDFAFCPHCGAKNEPPVESEPEIFICSNCGFESTEYNFCPDCGTQLLSKNDAKELLYDKANELVFMARWYEAMDCYDKAIELDSSDKNLWYGKGDCYDN